MSQHAIVITEGGASGHRFHIGEEIEVSNEPVRCGYYKAQNEDGLVQVLDAEDFKVIKD